MHIPEDAKLKKMLADMIRIRTCENRILDLFQKGQMFGLGHLSVGEEASPVGTMAALRDTDYIMSNHRGHGHAIAKGSSMRRIIAELMGRETGTNHGMGGSLHIVDTTVRDMGANGIVGAGIGQAAGIALANKYEGTDDLCVNFFGDGASNAGMFHEILNMSVLWKLPILFICENNQYGISTSVRNSVATSTIAQRACGYGIKGITVDGNDVLAVYNAVKEAAEDARRGIPALIELVTYRWYGHSLRVSGGGYRSNLEEQEWKARCPIKHFTNYLLENKICTQEEIDLFYEQAEAEVEDAVAFGLQSPILDLKTAQGFVFSGTDERGW